MSDLNQARTQEIAESNDGYDIYNGLGDLGNLPPLGEDGFPNIPNPWEETAYFDYTAAYMELDDLSVPLDDSNCGSETQHLVTDNSYPSYSVPIDVEQSHIRGNTSGSNEFDPGEGSFQCHERNDASKR